MTSFPYSIIRNLDVCLPFLEKIYTACILIIVLDPGITCHEYLIAAAFCYGMLHPLPKCS